MKKISSLLVLFFLLPALSSASVWLCPTKAFPENSDPKCDTEAVNAHNDLLKGNGNVGSTASTSSTNDTANVEEPSSETPAQIQSSNEEQTRELLLKIIALLEEEIKLIQSNGTQQSI